MKVIIIGGGIIGLSAAWYLQADGFDVVILEKGDLNDGCSFGNMGYLSPSHFAPLAQPGVLSQGLWWLFNAKSPFYVRPTLSRDMIDWGLKFMRHCNAAHVERSAGPMAELLLFSKELTAGWHRSGEIPFEYAEDGCIMYYKTPKKEKEEIEGAKQATQLGLKVEILSREQAQMLEPETRPDVRGGVWFKDDAHLDPGALMHRLQTKLEEKGVKILRNAPVDGVELRSGRIRAVSSGDNRYEADLFVLAAGSWSPQLAKEMGEHLPLVPGKGYSMTVDNPQVKLRIPCIFLESKVALTPWAGRLRIGSTMEIGPLNDKILFPRVQGILESVPRFMPGYSDDPVFRDLADLNKLKSNLRERVWYGFRPVSADGLPYIGYAKKTENLLISTGHGMLGVSMGAGAGKLIAEMAGGRKTSIPVEAFDPRRF